ncbi:MAG: hypothetical protein J5680_06330 [Neisseriaceae bacterium]|nr:hypothetical protein [Neisseriaceae bacterium]
MTDNIVSPLLSAFSNHYDTQQNYHFAGEVFAGYGEFHSRGEKYVLVKKAQIWAAEAHDYLFIQYLPHLDASMLQALIALLQTQGIQKVKPHSEHMQSSLTLIVLTDSVDDEALSVCRKTKFQKAFRFGWYGWANLRVAVVNRTTQSVMTNRAGKDLSCFLTRFLTTVSQHERKGHL